MRSRSSLSSTTLPPHHGRRGGDADQRTTARLSRRHRHSRRRAHPYGPEHRAASTMDARSPILMFGDLERGVPSTTDTLSPIFMSGDLHSLLSQPLDATDVGVQSQHLSQPLDAIDVGVQSQHLSQPLDATDVGVQSQHLSQPLDGTDVDVQELQESESELDSPPRISIVPIQEEEPDSPTSPRSPLSQPLDATDVGVQSQHLWQPLDGTDVDVQPQHQELQESESELDSRPRISIVPIQEEEPDSPTFMLASPPCVTSDSPTSMLTSPPCVTSVRVNASESPKDSPNDDEDEYFNYLVEKFVPTAANVCDSTLSDDEPDYKEQIHKAYALCAKRALEHYNNDDRNKIKYELISTTMCMNDMLVREGCFSHVNFTAKENQLNAKELFFAELRWDGDTPVPTCVICFKGIKKIGGLRGSKYDKFYLEGLPIDAQHCYACDGWLKHPRNGELYRIGHVAMSKHYSD